MTEFALVAPVLLLLTFGILDFGRALFFYAATGDSAREGARVAGRATSPMPTNAAVRNAVAVHFPGATLVSPSPDCANGPIPGGTPSGGTAWVFITDPSPTLAIDQDVSEPAEEAGEPAQPANAPGGEPPPGPGGPCSAIVPAIHNQILQVTVVYNYVPVTPLISSLVADHILFTLKVLVRTEY